jgi:MFS family permease
LARNPLIKPSLLRNRGFTAGLVIALAFFSVVTGLGYVVSLLLQQELGRTPVQTAISGIAPMAIGIIASSIVASPLIQRLGRRLVLAGLLMTLLGVIALWAVVFVQGMSLGFWSLLAPMFVIGLGMGTCFGSLFDIALGDIDPEEAGSASGSLSAVQQLAGSIGSAVIMSIWFGRLSSTPISAMVACLVVVAVVTVGCCGLVALLPRRAQAREAT